MSLDRRCGTCARFVRVVETIGETGEVKRTGDCLLGVWPSPLYETSTCSQWVRRGEFKARPVPSPRTRAPRVRRAPSAPGPAPDPAPLTLPEDLLEMDAEEFRQVLRSEE